MPFLKTYHNFGGVEGAPSVLHSFSGTVQRSLVNNIEKCHLMYCLLCE